MSNLLELNVYYDGRPTTGSVSPFGDVVKVVEIRPTALGTTVVSADGRVAPVVEVPVTKKEVETFMMSHV